VDHHVADDEDGGGQAWRLRPALARTRSARAAATAAATAALFLTSALLAAKLRPPVRAFTWSSRNGVSALCDTPAAVAARTAASTWASISAAGSASAAGMGLAISTPP